MLTLNRLFRTYMICGLLPLATAACSPKASGPKSNLEAVDIDQTTVKNQFRVGFCWAYAVMGFIESKHKMTTGETVDLSEEAIGFYRMADELLRVGQQYRQGVLSLTEAAARVKNPNALEGWYVRSAAGSRDGMELVDLYGAVPESEWSFKFTSEAHMKKLRDAVAPEFEALLNSTEPVTSDAVVRILTVAGAFPSAPPTMINYKGRSITATDFAKDILKFQSTDYSVMSARTAADSRKLVAAMKRSLAMGLSVPIGYRVDFSRLENGVFAGPDHLLSDLAASPNLYDGVFGQSKGGHAVLITDFVNNGGREGAVSSAELRSEVEKDIEDLQYIKFKNSWGTNARRNEAGVPVTAGSAGYYYMDRGYLKAAASVGHLSIVVPKAIALDPYGAITINAAVTNGR